MYIYTAKLRHKETNLIIEWTVIDKNLVDATLQIERWVENRHGHTYTFLSITREHGTVLLPLPEGYTP